MSRKGWLAEEHVLAGPVADLLRKACNELRDTREGAITQVGTSRNVLEKRYAERYLVTQRTAMRHFSLIFSQASVPVYIADRVAAMLGVPLAYIEAVS